MKRPLWSDWTIGGLVVPMPAPMPEVLEESPGDWMASQRLEDLTSRHDVLAAIAERWDTWATSLGLRILEARGPTATLPAITRTIDGEKLVIAFGLMGMPGQSWHVFVTVSRHE
jgi:hypothetical protein